MFEFSLETLFQLPIDPAIYMTTFSMLFTLTVTVSAAIYLTEIRQQASQYSDLGSELSLQVSSMDRLIGNQRLFISWAAVTIRRKDAPDDGKDDQASLF
jgi:hypothetical protein